MNPTDEDRVRAKRGTIGSWKYVIRLPDELGNRVRKAAKREGVSLAEWWRRAAEAALGVKR